MYIVHISDDDNNNNTKNSHKQVMPIISFPFAKKRKKHYISINLLKLQKEFEEENYHSKTLFDFRKKATKRIFRISN